MFHFIKRYIKRNYGIDKEYYRFIDDMFGFIPDNIELYKVALIHKSASQSIGGHHINNERLEYLGDAVIESITSDYLFIAYPDQNEGFLTQMRSKIVSRQSLNEMAVFIGLDKYLICKSGATLQQKHIYGDAFEAMMGAIYLDKGYEFTNRLLINDIYERFLSIDELSCSENDYKSRLIEWCQKNRHSLEFKTTKGVDKKSSTPIFYTTVFIDHIEMGHGTGDSKKTSEQSAACSVTREMSDEECARLLDKIDKLMDRMDPNQQPAETKQKQSKSARRKNRNEASQVEQPAVAEEAAEAAETADIADAADTAGPAAENIAEESAPEEQAQHTAQSKRRRRGRRKSTEAAEEGTTEIVENTAAEEVASPSEPSVVAEVVAEEKPAGKRRGRRKKSEQTTAEATATETTPAETESAPAESNEQPAKKRRGRRKKSEQATAETTATETTPAETENTPAESDEQPAKKRRGRRKKSEQTAAEAATTSAGNGEAPAAEAVSAEAAPVSEAVTTERQ